jgi:hypothetical protein
MKRLDLLKLLVPACGVDIQHDSSLHPAGFYDFMSARCLLQQHGHVSKPACASRARITRGLEFEELHLQRQYRVEAWAQRVRVHEREQTLQMLALNRIRTANAN